MNSVPGRIFIVSQGLILGPLLFNFFINDIFFILATCDMCRNYIMVIIFSNFYMFAQIYFFHHKWNEAWLLLT